MNEVEAAVKEVFGPLTPREDVSMDKLSELIIEVRKRVEGENDEDRRYLVYCPMFYITLTHLGHASG
jgi:peroxin-3